MWNVSHPDLKIKCVYFPRNFEVIKKRKTKESLFLAFLQNCNEEVSGKSQTVAIQIRNSNIKFWCAQKLGVSLQKRLKRNLHYLGTRNRYPNLYHWPFLNTSNILRLVFMKVLFLSHTDMDRKWVITTEIWQNDCVMLC